MKSFYDLILGLCCFKSVEQTSRLIYSTNKLAGDILIAITTVMPEDTKELHGRIHSMTNHDVMLMQSKVDSRYFCQNWGFVYCFNRGIHASFWGTMDDDTEFMGAGDLVNQLYEADRVGFSVMGFSSTSHGYAGYVGLETIGKYKSLIFVDGHNMFSHYEDNILYGLCDQFGEGNTSYVEVEYCNRLKYFTGKPIVANGERTFIRHLFRADPYVNSLRVPFESRDMKNGEELYLHKYGITIYPGDVAHFSWLSVIDEMNRCDTKQRLQQLCYGGMNMDWVEIYKKFGKEFTHVYP